MSQAMTPRQRILAAYAREEVDRPPVSPILTRWIRGHHGCTSPLQQLATAEHFGFDPILIFGAYFDNPLVNDYIYRPDGLDAYRDLPNVTVDVRTESQADRTVQRGWGQACSRTEASWLRRICGALPIDISVLWCGAAGEAHAEGGSDSGSNAGSVRTCMRWNPYGSGPATAPRRSLPSPP